jgi:putative thioredoxin
MLLGNNALNAAPTAPAAIDLVKDTDINGFMADVIDASLQQPVIVQFWSPRSTVCQQLTPVLEKLVLACRGAVRLVRVNSDKEPEIAQQFRIQSVPTVYAMFRGQPVDGFQGARTEPQVKQWLDKVLKTIGAGGVPDPLADLAPTLEQAEQALAAGDWQTAQDIFGDVLGLAPEHPAAYAGMVRSLLAGGELEAARTLLAATPAGIAKDKAIAAAQAALEVADQAAKAGPVTELAAQVAAHPADHQARFDLALALLAANERELAVEHLLEIVRQQRSWNEEAARQQLVKLFAAFGATDPLTISGRKRLSSLLFA